MHALLMSVLMLVLAAGTAGAQPVEMTVERMSPSSGFVLPRFGHLYIEIAYRSDRPLKIQARAYARGQSLDRGQMMNASILHPAGHGRALVSVGYSEEATIDEIRVTAHDADWAPLTTLPIPRPAQWLASAAEEYRRPPNWVMALIENEKAVQARHRIDHPPASDPWGYALVWFMFLAIPGYFLLQAAAWRSQRGGWRLAGMAPLLVMAPAALHAVLALVAGSNLWPIVVIFVAPICFLYLATLFCLRWVRAGGSFT